MEDVKRTSLLHRNGHKFFMNFYYFTSVPRDARFYLLHFLEHAHGSGQNIFLLLAFEAYKVWQQL